MTSRADAFTQSNAQVQVGAILTPQLPQEDALDGAMMVPVGRVATSVAVVADDVLSRMSEMDSDDGGFQAARRAAGVRVVVGDDDDESIDGMDERGPAREGEVHISLASGSVRNAVKIGRNDTETQRKAEDCFFRTREAIANHLVATGRLKPSQVRELRVEVDYTRQRATCWMEGDEDTKCEISLKEPAIKSKVHRLMEKMVLILGDQYCPFGFSGLHTYEPGYMGSLNHPNIFLTLDRASREKLPASLEAFFGDIPRVLGPNGDSDNAKEIMKKMAAAEIYKKKMTKGIQKEISKLVVELQAKIQEKNAAAQRGEGVGDLNREIIEMRQDLAELRKIEKRFADADLFPLYCLAVYGEDENAQPNESVRAHHLAEAVERHFVDVADVDLEVVPKDSPHVVRNERTWSHPISGEPHGLSSKQRDYASAAGSLALGDNDSAYRQYCEVRELSEDHNTGIEGRFLRDNMVNRTIEEREESFNSIFGSRIHIRELRGALEDCMQAAAADIDDVCQQIDDIQVGAQGAVHGQLVPTPSGGMVPVAQDDATFAMADVAQKGKAIMSAWHAKQAAPASSPAQQNNQGAASSPRQPRLNQAALASLGGSGSAHSRGGSAGSFAGQSRGAGVLSAVGAAGHHRALDSNDGSGEDDDPEGRPPSSVF